MKNKEHKKAALEAYGNKGSVNAAYKEYGKDLANKIGVNSKNSI